MAPVVQSVAQIKAMPRSRIREIDYPTGDGKPLAETDLHIQLTLQTLASLQSHYHDEPFIYTAGNNFLYYEEGNPRRVVSPDIYVVFGVENRLRDTYMVWKEGGVMPRVVFEFTSKSTQRNDNIRKFPLYEQVLKVDEYFRFDPRGDYLIPRLQGVRLENGYYTPIPMQDGTTIHSRNLGLDLIMDGTNLRLFDPETGEYLKTPQELLESNQGLVHNNQELVYNNQQIQQLLSQEAERARNAEEELARMRAELDKLKQQNAGE